MVPLIVASNDNSLIDSSWIGVSLSRQKRRWTRRAKHAEGHSVNEWATLDAKAIDEMIHYAGLLLWLIQILNCMASNAPSSSSLSSYGVVNTGSSLGVLESLELEDCSLTTDPRLREYSLAPRLSVSVGGGGGGGDSGGGGNCYSGGSSVGEHLSLGPKRHVGRQVQRGTAKRSERRATCEPKRRDFRAVSIRPMNLKRSVHRTWCWRRWQVALILICLLLISCRIHMRLQLIMCYEGPVIEGDTRCVKRDNDHTHVWRPLRSDESCQDGEQRTCEWRGSMYLCVGGLGRFSKFSSIELLVVVKSSESLVVLPVPSS